MDQRPVQSTPEPGPREAARRLIVDELGARRVADWCGVAENTVRQWLVRGTDANPVPPAQVPAIVAGAKAEGLAAPLSVLWPAMAEAQQ